MTAGSDLSARSAAPEKGAVLAVSDAAVERAVDVLARGGLVGLPTETVYGLAADATNGEAVAAVFAAKGRPKFNPLIVHVDGLARAEGLAELGAVERRLAAAFWPGPLTFVAPLRPGAGIHPLASAGLDTVALRCPRGVCAALVAGLDRPLAAPSANPSGRVSPTSAAAVVRLLKDRVGLVLDGGPCAAGLESTIVRAAEDRLVLLRPGAVPREALAEASGLAVADRAAQGAIDAPGQMRSHYAPSGRVRLDAHRVASGECLIAFGLPLPEGTSDAQAVFQLSETGSLAEAASRLFAALAHFDRPEIASIAVAPIPREGLGEAINDRLARAAAPRD